MKKIITILILAATLGSCATPKQVNYVDDLPSEFTLKCGDCRDLE